MTTQSSENRKRTTRRRLIIGAAAVAGGAGLYRAVSTPSLGAGDHRALIEDDRAALYERGLVPIKESGWTLRQGMRAAYPPLRASLDTDVLVIGAGLAGSSLALHLAEAGIDVVILEARQPGWGASGRNAGHVLPILKDIGVFRRFPDQGRAFLEAFRNHHTIPFDLSQKHGFDCDAVRSGYLNALPDKQAFNKFMADSAAHTEAQGLQSVTPLGSSDMLAATGSSHYPYGVVYENGGRINPYLFTHDMVKTAQRFGTRIFGDSEALSVAQDGKRWRVHTAAGDVRAQKIVFCTAAYPTDIVPAFEKAFYPLTAYAMTTNPLPKEARTLIMPGNATFAEAPVDLHPLVKDSHGRLILSSLPTSFNAASPPTHFKTQIEWLNRVWPDTRDMDITLEAYWTGRVAMRHEEFPGAYELEPGLLGLMHFNAWGNVMAPLMGMLLAEGLARDRLDALPFPLEKPEPVRFRNRQNILLRDILLPAARIARKTGLV